MKPFFPHLADWDDAQSTARQSMPVRMLISVAINVGLIALAGLGVAALEAAGWDLGIF